MKWSLIPLTLSALIGCTTNVYYPDPVLPAPVSEVPEPTPVVQPEPIIQTKIVKVPEQVIVYKTCPSAFAKATIATPLESVKKDYMEKKDPRGYVVTLEQYYQEYLSLLSLDNKNRKGCQ